MACTTEIKYIYGVKEHGGNLWEMSEWDLCWNTVLELIDGLEYQLTLLQKITK